MSLSPENNIDKFVNQDYYLNKVNDFIDAKVLTAKHMANFPEIFTDEPQPHNQLWLVNKHVVACKNGKVEGFVYDGNIISIADVFKPGNAPERNNAEYTMEDEISNYEECVDDFLRLYNQRTKVDRNITRKEAENKFRQFFYICKKKDFTRASFNLGRKIPNQHNMILIQIHDNNTVTLR